jgi:hypothetical protein
MKHLFLTIGLCLGLMGAVIAQTPVTTTNTVAWNASSNAVNYSNITYNVVSALTNLIAAQVTTNTSTAGVIASVNTNSLTVPASSILPVATTTNGNYNFWVQTQGQLGGIFYFSTWNELTVSYTAPLPTAPSNLQIH